MQLSKNSKIYLAGHNGMVGSAILRHLKKKNYKNIIVKSRKKLDLLNQKKTEKFFKKSRPDFVIIAAAKVGGILSNDIYRGEYIYQNLTIQTNLIHSSFKAGVKKLIFLGSSCIYPKFSKQPIKEDYLLNGKLEPTNDAYAIAKIAGIKMCEAYNKQYRLNYICLMPTNLYGPRDNYDLKNSHFFPALLYKIYNAKKYHKKKVVLWGNGKSKRELLYVDDLARACEFFLRKKTKHTLINIGSGVEKSIKDFAKFIMRKMKVDLKIDFDLSKPNGTPRKKLNISLAQSYGWKPKIDLNEGFNYVFKDFLKKKIK
jgi:GDP-L-fucose synthase